MNVDDQESKYVNMC